MALRGLVLAALVGIALNPTALLPRETPGKPALMILVDTSYSMATPDTGGRARLGTALATLRDGRVLAVLEDEFVLDVRHFDKDLEAANLAKMTADAAQGRASDIGAALSTAVNDIADRESQAGILLVSDGRATTEGATEAARLALARSVPLWTWCLGGEVPRRDLWLEVPNSEVLAFAGTEVELVGVLHEVGYENRSFNVEVLKDSQVVDRVEAVPGPDGRAPVKVKVTAPPQGDHRYVFRAVADPDEAERDNNERSVYLRVVGEKVRVLVAEGQPHWDTKFLVQCLKRNPRVELTAVYRLGENRQFAVVSAGGEQRREASDLFPRTAEQFAAYDVVILGRGCEAFFDEQTEDLLGQFVSRHGGGLVLSRGKAYGGRFMPLSKLEPVVWGEGAEQAVRLAPTEAGRESLLSDLATASDLGTLMERLPAFDQAGRTIGAKPLAVILARAESDRLAGSDEDVILLAYHHYGQGRVVTANASGLWRWAFREKQADEAEFLYDRFWMAMLRWLLSGSDFLAGSDVALRVDRRLLTDEQPMRFLVRTRGLDQEVYRPRLTIQGGDESTVVEPRRDATGAYVAEAGPFPPGAYEVKLTNNIGTPPEIAMSVQVVSSSVENRVLSADPELMGRLATISGGEALRLEDVPRMGEIVKQWRTRRQLAEQKVTLWDHWYVLTAILAVMGLEWFLRRREGLL